MKIYILLILLLPYIAVAQKAKKPTLMIVPSDDFCVQRGYFTENKTPGATSKYPDYKSALLDPELNSVLAKLAGIMADREYPLKDLATIMGKLETDQAELNMMQNKDGFSLTETPIDILKRTAKADILIKLYYEIKKQGFDNYCHFRLQGIDAYTGKVQSSVVGNGVPNSSAPADLLLEEAVLSHIENFNSGLQRHFYNMQENGREITLQVKVWDNAPFDLEEEFEYDGEEDELSFLIENMIVKKSVKNQAPNSDGTENSIIFEQVRIPFFDEKGRPLDAYRFARSIAKILKGPPFNVITKTYRKGLGEAWLIIGAK
jgi:hypothetical protein